MQGGGVGGGGWVGPTREREGKGEGGRWVGKGRGGGRWVRRG